MTSDARLFSVFNLYFFNMLNKHPADGKRMIIRSLYKSDSIVHPLLCAYNHYTREGGTGYPALLSMETATVLIDELPSQHYCMWNASEILGRCQKGYKEFSEFVSEIKRIGGANVINMFADQWLESISRLRAGKIADEKVECIGDVLIEFGKANRIGCFVSMVLEAKKELIFRKYMDKLMLALRNRTLDLDDDTVIQLRCVLRDHPGVFEQISDILSVDLNKLESTWIWRILDSLRTTMKKDDARIAESVEHAFARNGTDGLVDRVIYDIDKIKHREIIEMFMNGLSERVKSKTLNASRLSLYALFRGIAAFRSAPLSIMYIEIACIGNDADCIRRAVRDLDENFSEFNPGPDDIRTLHGILTRYNKTSYIQSVGWLSSACNSN